MPVPPEGPVQLVCEWPAYGIDLTRREIDAADIRAAARRAQVIFEPRAAQTPLDASPRRRTRPRG
jgi:hypothetical protein